MAFKKSRVAAPWGKQYGIAASSRSFRAWKLPPPTPPRWVRGGMVWSSEDMSHILPSLVMMMATPCTAEGLRLSMSREASLSISTSGGESSGGGVPCASSGSLGRPSVLSSALPWHPTNLFQYFSSRASARLQPASLIAAFVFAFLALCYALLAYIPSRSLPLATRALATLMQLPGLRGTAWRKDHGVVRELKLAHRDAPGPERIQLGLDAAHQLVLAHLVESSSLACVLPASNALPSRLAVSPALPSRKHPTNVSNHPVKKSITWLQPIACPRVVVDDHGPQESLH